MNVSICKFVKPKQQADDVINTLHFVYEKNPIKSGILHSDPMYRFHIVATGTGTLQTIHGSHVLKPGDVVITFPSMQYSFDFREDFTYMFISFLGVRGSKIMDKLSITKQNCIFHNYDVILPIWKQYLELADEETTEYLAESALLYAFAVLSSRLHFPEKETTTTQSVLEVKKYIDEFYHNAELNTEVLGRKFGYNPRYLSALFQRETGISISKYINSLRIQNACSLLEHGIKSIRDVAALCGYTDPLYFSKVFKKEMHVSPRIFISQQTLKQE